MKHLIIRNLGPVSEADLNLGQVNVIIGMQSSGKSCVLKTACYCAWVEKRIQLAQRPNGFGQDAAFIEKMAAYYKMNGYIKPDTYIAYETDYLRFSYDHARRQFSYQWKPDRWLFRRPKVSYVPADRNLVASIPSWSSIPLDGNMLDFLTDWKHARSHIRREENVLNLGLSYSYDSSTDTDRIHLDSGRDLTLKESSSGVQSLLPMFVHLDYLTDGQYGDSGRNISLDQKEEYDALRTVLRSEKLDDAIYQHFVDTHHSEVFLEEPEDNLFPPTQCQLMNWLVGRAAKHDDSLFIATHSPYVLNQLIKLDPKGLTVFFTHPSEGKKQQYGVRQLTDQEVHEIYDTGVDMFFNFELYV